METRIKVKTSKTEFDVSIFVAGSTRNRIKKIAADLGVSMKDLLEVWSKQMEKQYYKK